jgi:WD40 repeat protein
MTRSAPAAPFPPGTWIGLAVLTALTLGLYAVPLTAQVGKKDDKKQVKKDETKKEETKKEKKKLDEPLFSLKGHKDWVHRVVYSADGKHIASAGRDKTVKIWDAANGKEVLTIKDLPTSVKNVIFSGDNKRLLTTTGQWHKKEQQWIGEVRICDASTGKTLQTLKGHSETIECADLGRAGKLLATGSEDRTAKIWDLASGKELHTLKGHRGPVLGVSFNGDGTRLATAGDIIVTKKFEPKKEDKKKKDKKDDKKKEETKKEAEEPKGPGAEIKIWDAESGKEIRTLTGPTRSITCVVFSRDGKRIAAGSLDGTIRIWDAESGKELLTLKGHEGVWGIALNADGSKLATSGWDETIKIWDAASGKELRSIHGHERTVTSLAFSPDGQRLASGGLDQMIRIWSVK